MSPEPAIQSDQSLAAVRRWVSGRLAWEAFLRRADDREGPAAA